MALTEETLVDKVEVVGEHKMVHVRTATIIKRDGVEITREQSRHVVAPGDDTTGEDPTVAAICAAVHTSDVVTAYQNMLDTHE
jgi:hypothetical protein